MSTAAPSLPLALQRHGRVLAAAAVAGPIVYFMARVDGQPAAAPGGALAVGFLFTLTLATRVIGASFAQLPEHPQAESALRRLYRWQLGQIALLAGVTRILLTAGLLPFLWHDTVGAALTPLVVGWPLDVLLATMTVSLAVILGRGGVLLAVALAALTGALGQQAAVDGESFGALNGILQTLAFPWEQAQLLPEAMGGGDVAGLAAGVARLLVYWLAWVGVGVVALTWRARRQSSEAEASGTATQPPSPEKTAQV